MTGQKTTRLSDSSVNLIHGHLCSFRSGPIPGGFYAKIKNEITPRHLRCSMGGCPGVFTLSDGDLLIIGKALSPDLLEQVAGRVASDEIALKLSSEFFKALHK